MPRPSIVLDQEILGPRWRRVPKMARIDVELAEIPSCCEPDTWESPRLLTLLCGGVERLIHMVAMMAEAAS